MTRATVCTAMTLANQAAELVERAYTPDDYRNAPSGIGPLAAEWTDKPHRLVYDLAAAVVSLTAERDALREALAQCEPLIEHLDDDMLGTISKLRATIAALQPAGGGT